MARSYEARSYGRAILLPGNDADDLCNTERTGGHEMNTWNLTYQQGDTLEALADAIVCEQLEWQS